MVKNRSSKLEVRSSSFLIEIGTEEIPSADLDSALKQIKTAFINLAQKQNIAFDEKNMKVMGTPRRIAVFIKEFPNKQNDIISKKIKGPPAAIAYKDAKPLPATIGFAKAQGIKVEEIIIEETEKGPYLFAATTKSGRPSKEILAEEIPSIISSIEFKKAMRWSDSARFIRPIRWLAALLGSEIIPFKYADVASSNITYGHRLLAPNSFKIKKADEYKQIMKEAKVVVENQQREHIIKKSLTSTDEGWVDIDNARIYKTFREVINLVENPQAIIASFDKKFLKLPQKVIETVLQSHQRYFPILEGKNPPQSPFTKGESKLTNHFVVIHNGNQKYKKIIQHGHQKVVKARLEDADFYVAEDGQFKLSDKVKELTGIVFHEGIGNLLDKTKRVQFLAKKIAAEIGLKQQDIENANRAAYLSKADLLTSMVGEFDELQGAIGAEYARRDGENKEVAKAIEEQYLPKHAKDNVPATAIGKVLSIADRIDTLCAYTAISILPTSAGDPYALRRQSTGLVDILFQSEYKLSIPALAKMAYKKLSNDFANLESESFVLEKTFELVNQRIEWRLSQMGIDYDIIRAVAVLGIEQPAEVKLRAIALQAVRDTDETTLQDLVTAYNRAFSIAESGHGLKINTALFEESAEKNLYSQLLNAEAKLDELIEADKYNQAIKVLAQLRKTVDVFFDDVLVNAKQAPLKKNRHALLNNFVTTCLKVADLSKIVKTS